MEEIISNVLGKTRRTTLGGREYLVAPLTLIVPGVLNGSKGPLLYSIDELAKNTEAWNHIPIVVRHPIRNGQHVSARDPDVLETCHIGHVFRANANGKLRAEGWFDVVATKKVEPSILDRLEKNQSIELSTGLYTDNEYAPGEYKGRAYTHVAKNYRPDHLAILPDQRGACSIEDGCGVMINAWGPAAREKSLRVRRELAAEREGSEVHPRTPGSPGEPRTLESAMSQDVLGGLNFLRSLGASIRVSREPPLPKPPLARLASRSMVQILGDALSEAYLQTKIAAVPSLVREGRTPEQLREYAKNASGAITLRNLFLSGTIGAAGAGLSTAWKILKTTVPWAARPLMGAVGIVQRHNRPRTIIGNASLEEIFMKFFEELKNPEKARQFEEALEKIRSEVGDELAANAKFEEEKHPRDAQGKWASVGAAGGHAAEGIGRVAEAIGGASIEVTKKIVGKAFNVIREEFGEVGGAVGFVVGANIGVTAAVLTGGAVIPGLIVGGLGAIAMRNVMKKFVRHYVSEAEAESKTRNMIRNESLAAMLEKMIKDVGKEVGKKVEVDREALEEEINRLKSLSIDELKKRVKETLDKLTDNAFVVNPPSWIGDEKIWKKAKAAAKKYEGKDNYYAVVTSIYKKMGGKAKKRTNNVWSDEACAAAIEARKKGGGTSSGGIDKEKEEKDKKQKKLDQARHDLHEERWKDTNSRLSERQRDKRDKRVSAKLDARYADTVEKAQLAGRGAEKRSKDAVAGLEVSNFLGGTMDRSEMIDFLIANCEGCWNEEDREVLEGFSDQKLSRIAFNLKKKEAEVDEEDEEEEDEEEEEEKTANAWLEAAPPEIRSAVLNAMEIEKKEKILLVNRLLVNVSAKERNNYQRDFQNESLQKLRKLIRLLPETKPLFIGATGGPIINDDLDKDDVLSLPVMNYSNK